MSPDSGPELRRRDVLLAALSLLAGCGGGVDSGGTGTGVASTYSYGPIVGFGSIIVNGVHYDDSAAAIAGDDGTARTRADLKLGMQTEVLASAVTVSAGVSSATASTIQLRSEIVGPVQAIDAANQRLDVLGQSVQVQPGTVFDAGLANGFASLAVGDLVEVYANFDVTSGRFVSTRIEPRSAPAAYKVRGLVGTVSLSARTITIGALTVSWAALAPADPAAALAVGTAVRVVLSTTPLAGVWTATALQTGKPALADRERAELEGHVSAFTSTTWFAVNGVTVDATAASFPNGSTELTLGARVSVKGSLRGGTLVATSVAVEDGSEGEQGYELHGSIDALDASAQSFVVHGVSVVWSATTTFEGGTAASLVVGVNVEVKGPLSADGTRVDAVSVQLVD
jgi:hypothetical protein